MPMAGRSVVSPHNQKVTWVELFFDLVFVFAVTQVVDILENRFGWVAVIRALLVFWLIWWAWTQFTWALNAADTTHPHVELATLIATAIAFFMAVAVPLAFEVQPLAFALPYVLVRGVGLYIYSWVACENPSQRGAVRKFTLVSISGLLAVLAGSFFSEGAQYLLWGTAILLDLLAAAVGGRQEGWNLHAEHFAERHGLFVIIALGESLIVAASRLSGMELSPDRLAAAVLSVAVTCGLWWIYFTRTKPELDRTLESRTGVEQSTMARDVFSLLHFPMLCGIIAYAFSIEEAMLHPAEPLHIPVRGALAAGIVLFAGGMVPAMWRANGILLWSRALIVVVLAVNVLVIPAAPAIALSIVFVGTVAIALLEARLAQLKSSQSR